MKKPRRSKPARSPRGEVLGPRGGTTTISTNGMVKKNLWMDEELAELLRLRAFEQRRSEAEIVRQALRAALEPGPDA